VVLKGCSGALTAGKVFEGLEGCYAYSTWRDASSQTWANSASWLMPPSPFCSLDMVASGVVVSLVGWAGAGANGGTG
jgi:hypothetical protein